MICLQIPQYRFHYHVQGDKAETSKSHEEYRNEAKVQDPYNVTDNGGEVRFVSYRADKSNGLQMNVDYQNGASPFMISLNNPTYSVPQINTSDEPAASSESSPIVVEPIADTQEQKSLKSIEVDAAMTESTDKVAQLIEQLSTNRTEDRNDDVKEEQQVTDQIIIQEDDATEKQTEFTIPFKQPNPVSADDFKYDNDDEALKKNIVKVIQNINGGGHDERSDSQMNFKSDISDKPMKIIGTDSSTETERQPQETYRPSQEHSSFKSQQLSNKPLRLIGFNPSIFGSLYETQPVHNKPSKVQQIPYQQPSNAGFHNSEDVKPLNAYDSSGTYVSQQSSNIHAGSHQKYTLPLTQQLYHYDPNSNSMIPVYTTNMIQNMIPVAESKPQPPPQADSNKNGFNFMQILSGGTFYNKGSEQQADGSQQQTATKDKVTKHEHNKMEKSKPPPPQQTVMFVLNPGETPIDLKSFTSSPMQLTFGHQPQADCNNPKHKTPAVKIDKTLQPIPLCTDCVPTLALMGMPNAKPAAAVQQKKSIASPQVIPLWNGKNDSKLNYLILPTPITKK